MQRVSSLLPSWEKRTSSGSAIASTDAADTVTSPQRVTSASSTSSAAGGGFWGWSKRSSTSTKTNSLSKINTAAANRNSSLSVRSTARVHGETFWPTSLDLECEKAARIIKSFCADGYLGPIDDESSPVVSPTNDEPPKTPVKIYKKIPKQIIQNAAGIAVFSCMRNGLWMTGSGGSGILIARKSDGTWSPPSGIMLHTPTLSFIIGVDVYDCVLVVNSLAALESMTRPKVTLGEDVGLAYGASVSMEARDIEINVRDLGNTVMTYMKARGQEQKVNLHGSILTERANENERFYGSAVSQMEVLSGAVARYVEETQPLFEVIKMAEGRTDFDASMIGRIAAEPAPSDAIIVSPKFSAAPLSPAPRAFGLLNSEDPDPFGILALEMAGMEIREAGSRARPTSSQLDFHPQRMSSLSKVQRQSIETSNNRSNRGSLMSTRTVKSQTTDVATQTDTGNTSETSPSPGRSENGQGRGSTEIAKNTADDVEHEEIDFTVIDMSALDRIRQPLVDESAATVDSSKLGPLHAAASDFETASKASSNYGDADENELEKDTPVPSSKVAEEDDDELDEDEDDDDEDDDEEEPVIFEVATVQPARTQVVASRVVQAKGNVVTIPKRIPPPLPTRNPARASTASRSDIGGDAMSPYPHSPLRKNFSDAELAAGEDENQDTSSLDPERAVSRRRSAEPEGLTINVSKADESSLRTPKAFEVSPQAATVRASLKDDAILETSTVDQNETQIKDQESIKSARSLDDADDKSDSIGKSRLSVDTGVTGVTDDRSSIEESSYTTPTSEQRFSFGENVNDNTPKKPEMYLAEPPAVIDTPKKTEATVERLLSEKANESSLPVEKPTVTTVSAS
ncbi:unnamed protein product [Clonostachys rhizophaga]|uniref:Ysc84 actin-binding domain-containing protein n=1 Tax=Clonostachys rhizophaga TaxID=160324 RepID=A0A9N9YBW2_9HYPO|nr:unnamed protein product [Clonostachys rhizophaga]